MMRMVPGFSLQIQQAAIVPRMHGVNKSILTRCHSVSWKAYPLMRREAVRPRPVLHSRSGRPECHGCSGRGALPGATITWAGGRESQNGWAGSKPNRMAVLEHVNPTVSWTTRPRRTRPCPARRLCPGCPRRRPPALPAPTPARRPPRRRKSPPWWRPATPASCAPTV